MRRRVAELVGPRAERMWVSTFHSACVRILRAARRPAGLQGVVHHLRRRRLAPAGRDHLPRAGHRHQEAVAALDPRPDQPGQVAASRARSSTGPPRSPSSTAGSPTSSTSTSSGCWRPTPWTSTTCCSTRSGCSGEHPDVLEHYRDPLHPRPDRRVPGHQPRAERAGRPAGRRAPQHRGGRGQRPVGLPVPGRRHLQHPRLRAGVPRRHGHHPRPELPLDPDHPRRGQRGDHQQRLPQAQVALDGSEAAEARSSATGPRTSTTRPSGWPTRSSACAATRSLRWGDVAVFYRTNAQSRGPRGGHGPGRGPLQGGRAAPSSTTAARSRTSSPICGSWSIPTTRSAGGAS